MKAFTAFATLASLAIASASNVITLDPKNFDSVIYGGTPSLVEFYAVCIPLSSS